MNTAEVGERLVNLCKEGRNSEAIEQLYADDIVSVEAAAAGPLPRRMEGKEQIRGKNEWWEANNEVHSAEVAGPFLHGDDRFAAIFDFDVTRKDTGERSRMKEVAIYTVDGGKITQEEFYYTM
jgi:ketosteroid isomerase-like protein